MNIYKYIWVALLMTGWWHSGVGSRPVMPYRGLRPIRQFLHWLKQVDEDCMLGRAVIGGYFSYPPLPISLQSFMENREGKEKEDAMDTKMASNTKWAACTSPIESSTCLSDSTCINCSPVMSWDPLPSLVWTRHSAIYNPWYVIYIMSHSISGFISLMWHTGAGFMIAWW